MQRPCSQLHQRSVASAQRSVRARLAVRCQAKPNGEDKNGASVVDKMGLGDLLGPIGLTVGKSLEQNGVKVCGGETVEQWNYL